jgi:leucyl/phenylalanyl-tRNA--protein transferase
VRGEELTPELLLAAYAQGLFPMAEGRDDPEVHWIEPKRRGLLPLDGFHVSRSLGRVIRQGRFRASFDRDFAGVVAGCAERETTWISGAIARAYARLHARGHAHSVEVWEGEELVGGVYGVSLGAAFFGESMFSRRTDASKVALWHLVGRLGACGFRLFDTQFLTPHLASLGGVEVPRGTYRRLLEEALRHEAVFDASPPGGRAAG